MIRRLMVILLSGAISLLGATSALTAKFTEAPMLRTMVAAGELPPVEERLPEEPLVVKPLESVGKYGGTLLLIQRGVSDWGLPANINVESLLGCSREDPYKIVPNIAKGWELSKDAKSFTLYLRKGLRWSDGVPFTADDILFWYNDILLNKELTPRISTTWSPGGKVMQVEKIDDYTVKFKFSMPWPGALYVFSYERGMYSHQGQSFNCAHYLKKFHIKYNPDANKLAREKGFEYWYQLFENKREFWRGGQPNPELPVLGAWVTKVVAPDHVSFSRNPYYWKVDTEGNQLPYIDRTRGVLAEDPELRAAKVFAGEPDLHSEIDIKKLPVLKSTAKKNNYQIFLVPLYTSRILEVTIFPNQTVEDPFLKELFNNVKFKQALSLAIDRDEISEVVYLGTVEPMQATVSPGCPFYEERFGKAYTSYDPERAKKLLDEIGLKRNKEGYILCPDGKRLSLVLEIAPWIDEHTPTAELIADYWDKIGLKTTVHLSPEMWNLFSANKSHLSLWVLDRAGYDDIMISPPWWAGGWFWAREWQLWFQSDGKEGTEPPPKAKQFITSWYKIPYIANEEERNRVARTALELLNENLWMIGVVGKASLPSICRKSLKNVNVKLPRYGRREAFQYYFEK